MHPAVPISAIVIFRNEERLLSDCLAALRPWCDEVIGVDMRSTDGSLDIAKPYADRLYSVAPFPIAEPTRVAAARLAAHDWVLLIDPDEHVSPTLVPRIARTLTEHADAAAICLPWLFHFKGQPLPGTIWGGTHHTKRMLVHRRRCDLLPYCNRIVEPKPGFREVTIPAEGDAIVRHYWCDSYRRLIHRHLFRYPPLDAARMAGEGLRFSPIRAFCRPVTEFLRSYRDFDGWRMGRRGLALSATFALYTAAYEWMLLKRSVRQPGAGADDALPTLEPIHLPTHTHRSAA